MLEEQFQERKDAYICNLVKSPQKIEELEKTRRQTQSPLWMEERQKLLKASNFGTICNKLPHTSIIKCILYSNINMWGMQYRRMHERDAKANIETLEKITVLECGLFVDEELHFSGATPDGVIENNDRILMN